LKSAPPKNKPAPGPSNSKSGARVSKSSRAKPTSTKSNAPSPTSPNYLFRSQEFIHGAILLTGTGIVPPDDFTLTDHDKIMIEVSGIGTLTNTVTVV
jgi:fumarylacetoacetate (FAA) hydrolase family protein